MLLLYTTRTIIQLNRQWQMKRFLKFLPNLLLGLTEVSVTNGSLGPCLFSALTRNWYSDPSNKFWTKNEVLFGLIRSTWVHVGRVASFFSIMNPVRGEPPSSVGGCHVNVRDVFSISLTSKGPTGEPGLPV